jgi:hypothetical protein
VKKTINIENRQSDEEKKNKKTVKGISAMEHWTKNTHSSQGQRVKHQN